MAYLNKFFLITLLYLFFTGNIHPVYGVSFTPGTNIPEMLPGNNATITGAREANYIYEPEPAEEPTIFKKNESGRYSLTQEEQNSGAAYIYRPKPGDMTIATEKNITIERQSLPVLELYTFDIEEDKYILSGEIAVTEDGQTFFLMDEQTAVAYLDDGQGNQTGTEIYYRGRLIEKHLITGETIVIEGEYLPVSEIYEVIDGEEILSGKIAVSEKGQTFFIVDGQTIITYLYDRHGNKTETKIYSKGQLIEKYLVTRETIVIEGEYLPVSEVYAVIDGKEILSNKVAVSEDGRNFFIVDDQTAMAYLYDEYGNETGTEIYYNGQLIEKRFLTGEIITIEGEYLPVSEVYEVVDGREILVDKIAVSGDGRIFFILDDQTAIAYLYDEQGNEIGTGVYYKGQLIEKSITTGETIIIEGQSMLTFETYKIINGEEFFSFKRAISGSGRVFEFTGEKTLVELIYDDEGNVLEAIPVEIQP